MSEWLKIGTEGERAYLAVPASGSGPGVLVIHAWWGLTDDVTDVCDWLASEGFVALAPGLFSGGATADTIDGAEALVTGQDSAASEAVVQAAVDHLRGLQAMTGAQIGTIGFSYGANWALNLSQTRPDDVSAVVAVYGADAGNYDTSRAAYLGHWAEHDDFEPLEVVQALEEKIRAAGCEVTFHTYPGTGHWFVEPSRTDAYNAEAAALVWDRTLAFFKAQLG